MRRNNAGKRYAIVLAQYIAKFHQVPPSILTERDATQLMLEALWRERPIELSRAASLEIRAPLH